MKKHGFTLVELLVVLAIIAILSALLFPVLKSAKESALRSTCQSNYGQALRAQSMYSNDYDDRYVVSGYLVSTDDPVKNRLWPQLLQPYFHNFSTFVCPADNTKRPKFEEIFSADLSLADPEAKSFLLAQRTNLGYNAYYFSPMVASGAALMPRAITTSEIGNAANTIIMLDSVWTVKNDQPSGGGRWIVKPPCRFTNLNGLRVDTSNDNTNLSVDEAGWTQPNTSDRFGGAWAWHGEFMTVAYSDGHVKAIRPAKLTDGCNFKQSWNGDIFDLEIFSWDLR